MAAATSKQLYNYMVSQRASHGNMSLSFPAPMLARAMGVDQQYLESELLEDLIERGKVHRTGMSKDPMTGNTWANYALGRGW